MTTNDNEDGISSCSIVNIHAKKLRSKKTDSGDVWIQAKCFTNDKWQGIMEINDSVFIYQEPYVNTVYYTQTIIHIKSLPTVTGTLLSNILHIFER
jgi:hypothetical protein